MRHNIFTHTLMILATCIFTINAATANNGIYSDKARFVRSFINNIKIPLDVAVQEAIFQCGDEGSAPCTCTATTLSDGAGATDVYVDTLSIDPSCVVTLTVRSTALSSSTLDDESIDNEVPTFTAALSKTIKLTPDRSSVVGGEIKSWACTTSIDGNLKPFFQGMAVIADGDSSVLSKYNDEPYLGTCTYDSSL